MGSSPLASIVSNLVQVLEIEKTRGTFQEARQGTKIFLETPLDPHEVLSGGTVMRSLD